MAIMTTLGSTDAQTDSRGDINNNFSRRHGYDIVSKATADSPYTVPNTDDDSATMLNADSGDITVNLPTAVGIAGRTFLFVRTDANTTYTVTLTPDGASPAETIDNASSKTIAVSSSVRIMSDGADWWTV
jgi:hypothetical protein